MKKLCRAGNLVVTLQIGYIGSVAKNWKKNTLGTTMQVVCFFPSLAPIIGNTTAMLTYVMLHFFPTFTPKS
jgi:hypothetical protein